jgi:hypothetical protein
MPVTKCIPIVGQEGVAPHGVYITPVCVVFHRSVVMATAKTVRQSLWEAQQCFHAWCSSVQPQTLPACEPVWVMIIISCRNSVRCCACL